MVVPSPASLADLIDTCFTNCAPKSSIWSLSWPKAFAQLTPSFVILTSPPGVCIKTDVKTHVFHDATEVEFYPLTNNQIMSYIQNCQPFDKAGSYGIQDWMGYLGVKRIDGCYFNVMGFPSGKFYREFTNFI